VTFPIHPLTGFSHGASGFAWALAELFAVNGDPILARTVIAASTFERSFFYPKAMEWADLRSGRPGPDKPPEFMTAWCHGACGIGMARLGMRQHLRDEAIDRDLRIALNTTFEKGFGSNHSLCHGDLGSLMLLLQASRQLPGEGWDQRLATRTAQTLASIEDHGWHCGVSLGVETPGLMDGLAGIGLGLLYLADPDRIPAVLMLEGPKNPFK
jgi:lantibiotic modifying enzyme